MGSGKHEDGIWEHSDDGASNASSHSIFLGHGSQNCPLTHGSEMFEKWSMAGEYRSSSPTWILENENLGGNLVEPDKQHV